MTDLATIKAAAKATIIEAAPSLGSNRMWTLSHYEYGRNVNGSVARGDEIHEWLTDLEKAGFIIATAWDLRGEPAPDGWPGWTPWPTSNYWHAIETAFDAAGIEIWDSTSDGCHDMCYQLAPPFPDEYGQFYVGWNVGEQRNPHGGFSGTGWYWLGIQSSEEGGGRIVGQLGVDSGAEPEAVAAAVAKLVGVDR